MLTLQDMRGLVHDDWTTLNQRIHQHLSSDVFLIQQVAGHITESGGKRLRPLLTLLAAHAIGCHSPHVVCLGIVIEFIHNATLLHDDVVDESDLRRGRKTANHLWGNTASILVGDFLYSRAFELMVTTDQLNVMRILAKATNEIAEGEVFQLMHCHNPDTTEADYFEIIRRKTATLFQAAATLPCVLLKPPPLETQHALADYGHHLGLAFQITDDLLDYTADATTLGKNIGDDLREGKPTLPIIYALQNSTPEQEQLLRHAIEHGETKDTDRILTILEETGAYHYTQQQAKQMAEKAQSSLEKLPSTPFKQALSALTQLAVTRTN